MVKKILKKLYKFLDPTVENFSCTVTSRSFGRKIRMPKKEVKDE